jgi:hypothetical protein
MCDYLLRIIHMARQPKSQWQKIIFLTISTGSHQGVPFFRGADRKSSLLKKTKRVHHLQSLLIFRGIA